VRVAFKRKLEFAKIKNRTEVIGAIESVGPSTKTSHMARMAQAIILETIITAVTTIQETTVSETTTAFHLIVNARALQLLRGSATNKNATTFTTPVTDQPGDSGDTGENARSLAEMEK